MPYLEHEAQYREAARQYLSRGLAPAQFVQTFLHQWRLDRDEQFRDIEAGQATSKEERALCSVLDEIMVACDCYEPQPIGKADMDAKEFYARVKNLATSRWPEIGP